MKPRKYNVLFLLGFICFYSCTLIHDTVEDEGIDPTLVNVYIAFTLPEDAFSIPDTPSDGAPANTRYTFEVTPKVMKMKGDTTRQSVFITSTPLTQGDTLTFPVKISPAENNIRVWVDHIPAENTSASYYNTCNLSSVTVTTPYQANTNQKIAFAGSLDIDLTRFKGQEYAETVVPLELTSPFGTFRVLTTDYREYIHDHPGVAPIKIEIKYRNYYPCGYHVGNQCANLNDFKTNISFTGELTEQSDHSALIAYDHVFVSSDQPDIAIDLFFYSADGTLIQKVKNILVPIERGKLTTISDNFLTQEFEDPDENSGTTIE